jgi:protein TonB
MHNHRQLLPLAIAVAAIVLQCCTTTVPNAPPPRNAQTWVDTPVGRAVRPGGTVKAPAVITRVTPTYPAGTDDLVLLEVVIDEQGKVANAKVLDAPSPALADAAATAVRQWTFEPTEIDGQRVKVLHAVAIKFKLP